MVLVSVILTQNNLIQLRDYHCIGCGRKSFMANRDILAMWVGPSYPAHQIPLNMGWVQHKCRGCDTTINVYFQ